jgi:membrane associated rhomboid family serine protease
MPYHLNTGIGAGFPPVGRAVKALLIATFCVSGLQLVSDMLARGGGSYTSFSAIFSLSWWGLRHGRLWQPLTYMFLHGGILHLFFNMLMLYVFGRDMEGKLGPRRFLLLYLACGLIAGIGWLLISGGGGQHCIGASGAVLGIMGAMAAVYPHRRITLLIMLVFPVTLTMRTLAVVLGSIALVSLLSSDGNVAHAAHLAGGFAGYLYGYQVALGRGPDPRRWFGARPRPRRERGHLTILDLPEEDAVPTPEEVDAVLEKLQREGMRSLTRRERRILERASRES